MLVKVHTFLQVFVMTKEVPLIIIIIFFNFTTGFLDFIKCFSATSFKVTGFKHFKFECYPNAYKNIHIYSLTMQRYRAQDSQNFPTRPNWILGLQSLNIYSHFWDFLQLLHQKGRGFLQTWCCSCQLHTSIWDTVVHLSLNCMPRSHLQVCFKFSLPPPANHLSNTQTGGHGIAAEISNLGIHAGPTLSLYQGMNHRG